MKLVQFCLFVLLLGCKTNDKKPLIPKDETSEAEKRNTLFAFVGEKISVQLLPQDSGSWDGKFEGKYKILERIYGDYPKDTIEFKAYDHYGIPGFSHYKNALLFVSEYKGKYYHEKYQYFDVYLTKENRWAGTYNDHEDYGKIKPEKIAFADSVYLQTKIMNNAGEVVDLNYSPPYYRIIDDKAYPLYGNYVEDLFAIKKNGVLKWRGLFGKGNENWQDSLVNTKLEEIKR